MQQPDTKKISDLVQSRFAKPLKLEKCQRKMRWHSFKRINWELLMQFLCDSGWHLIEGIDALCFPVFNLRCSVASVVLPRCRRRPIRAA